MRTGAPRYEPRLRRLPRSRSHSPFRALTVLLVGGRFEQADLT